MLYNIEIGLNSNEEWKLMEDDHKNLFLSKPNIRQRIRLDQRIASDPNMRFNQVNSSEGVNVYELYTSNLECKKMKFVNNNKNMNPMIMPVYKYDNDQSNFNVAYITIDANYKLLSYVTNYRILQSFHSQGVYQGCAVIFSDAELENNNDYRTILSMNVKDKTDNKFYNIVVEIAQNLTASYSIQLIKSHNIIKNLMVTDKKYKNTLGFKIKTYPGELITSTYLVSPEKEEVILQKTAHIKNRNVVVFTEETLGDADTMRQILTEELTNKRIRTFTSCGIQLPLNICKEYRQLYVFDYDEENDILHCKKSN